MIHILALSSFPYSKKIVRGVLNSCDDLDLRSRARSLFQSASMPLMGACECFHAGAAYVGELFFLGKWGLSLVRED